MMIYFAANLFRKISVLYGKIEYSIYHIIITFLYFNLVLDDTINFTICIIITLILRMSGVIRMCLEASCTI